MEMIQFHPTGLVIPDSLMTGALLEEGLRGAGGHLKNGRGERYMERYDPARMERSTRDLVARASFLEVTEGRGTPNGGVWIDVSHLGADVVERNFRGMSSVSRHPWAGRRSAHRGGASEHPSVRAARRRGRGCIGRRRVPAASARVRAHARGHGRLRPCPE